MTYWLGARKAFGVHRLDLVVATGLSEATLIAWEKGLAQPTAGQRVKWAVGINKCRKGA